MRKSTATLVPLTQNEPPHNPPIHIVLFERQLHPAGIIAAAPKAFVRRIRFQPDCVGQIAPPPAFRYFIA
jgi:hypothetical protein